jgi:glutathione peroxidase-family protein
MSIESRLNKLEQRLTRKQHKRVFIGFDCGSGVYKSIKDGIKYTADELNNSFDVVVKVAVIGQNKEPVYA